MRCGHSDFPGNKNRSREPEPRLKAVLHKKKNSRGTMNRPGEKHKHYHVADIG